MKASDPLVSVVILNWNGLEDTKLCLKYINRQTYSNYEVIVVDNGSSDGSVDYLKTVKGIRLVINKENKGFTGGHIDGLKYSEGKYIFVLNNDAVTDDNYIKYAVNILENDPKIAVVGGRSYHWDDADQLFDKSGPFYSFQTINRYSLEGIFSQSDKGYDHEVNWVSGSAMIIRKDAIEKVGYFYDPMFAYYEESDLFARLQAADYTIVYSPKLMIWHKDGASSSSYFQLYQLFRNRFIYAIRNLKLADFIKFIRSYLNTTLKGAYHYTIKDSKNSHETTMNKALTMALLYSFLHWPRFALANKNTPRTNASGFSLTDSQRIEQTGLSFIAELGSNPEQISSLINFIKTISYKHYNSEIVLVCDQGKKSLLEKLIKKYDLLDTNLKLVFNTNQSKTNPLNLCWLSSSKDYIWPITTSYQPTIEKIYHACLQFDETRMTFYSDSIKDTCLSRSILGIYGGFDTKSIDTSLANIYYTSKQIRGVKTVLSTNSRNKLDGLIKNISHDTKCKASLYINDFKRSQKEGSRYHKLLKTNYRLYQFDNLINWIFVKTITSRHKLARIRTIILATLSLNKRKLALELKHVSNETVNSRRGGITQDEYYKYLNEKIHMSLDSNNWMSTPVFIICRDRLTDVDKIVSWLEKFKLTNIYLIDNDSSYKPMLKYFDGSEYQVIKTGNNVGHKVVWESGIAKTLSPGEFYIVSDPDVIPIEECPDDVLPYLYNIHLRYLDYQKVGLSLKIDDIPDFYPLKEEVIKWETQFWNIELENNVYDAGIDTTFALYKPFTYTYILNPSIRTGSPYQARHLAWYNNPSIPDAEQVYYAQHANHNISTWSTDELPQRYKKEMIKN